MKTLTPLKPRAWLLCLPLLLNGLAAQAQDQIVELQSNGGYASYRLADDVSQVDLVEQTQGACRFNRTWGFDLTNRELWANGGCGGRFRITRSFAGGNQGGAYHPGHSQRPDYDRRPDPGYGVGGGERELRADGQLCLDVTKGNFRPGTALQVYECNGTASQRFSFGRGGEIRVRDLCVDADRGDSRDGTAVVLWPCSGSRSQSWGTRGGQIINQQSGKCLDVQEGRIRQGHGAMLWSCNRSPSQRWF